MLVSVIGDETDIQDLADEARAIFTRLGAKPFLTRLDAALTLPSSGVPGDRRSHQPTAPGASVTTR